MTEQTFRRELVTQAFVTPECREKRGVDGAWEEAVRRLREEFGQVLEGWDPEQPTLVLSLYLERPVEDHTPAIPPLPTEGGASDE